MRKGAATARGELLRKLLGGGPLGMGSAERAELLRDERAMADLFGRAPPAACRQAVGTAFGSLLSEEQALVQDVWREVSKQYVDGSFNGLGADGWKAKQSEALRGLAGKQGGMGEAYDAIREMLRALGDPAHRVCRIDILRFEV